MNGFKGKVALVTGASSGIGEAIAIALAQEGAVVHLVARDAARLETVRGRCVAAGGQAWVHVADVTQEKQVRQVADAVHAAHPSLDVLVNNAGVVMAGLLTEVTTDDWHRLLDINVMGVVHGCQAFVPKMVARGQGGHVVNVGSVAGLVGQRGMSTYCASKFAVTGLTECLRAELHRFGIGVTLVAPGYVQTPIATKVKMVGAMDTPKAREAVDAEFKRGVTAEEVAQRTLQAIRANEAVATIGRDAKMATFMRRWAPGLLARWQAGGRKSRKKAA